MLHMFLYELSAWLKKYIQEREAIIMRIIIILLILVISGCATLNHDHHHRRQNNSLSRAIETGNTGGSRRVHNDIDDVGSAIVEVIFNNENHPPRPPAPVTVNEQYWRPDLSGTFSFDVTRSVEADKQVEDISRYSFILGRREEYFSFLAHVAVTDYDFKKEWRYYNELENPWSIEAGVGLQFYFAGRKSFIQPFIKTGYAYGKMYWEYRYRIYNSNTGDDITGDSTGYSRLSGAIGVDFKISDYLDLSVDIQKDYTIYSEITGRGFEDDIMSNFGSTLFGTRLTWHF